MQEFLQVDDGDTGGDIAHRVRKNEVAGMDHGAAGINDVWYIANFLPARWNEDRFGGLSDDAGRVLEIEKEQREAAKRDEDRAQETP